MANAAIQSNLHFNRPIALQAEERETKQNGSPRIQSLFTSTAHSMTALTELPGVEAVNDTDMYCKRFVFTANQTIHINVIFSYE